MTAWDEYVDTVIILGMAKTHLVVLTNFICDLDERCDTGVTSNTAYQLSRIGFELGLIEKELQEALKTAKKE